MFGLSIVKTADLNNLKVRVADLETDIDGALDKVSALDRKYNGLLDQVQRNDKAVRVQLDALAKPEVCPLLTAVPKHVTDPVWHGAYSEPDHWLPWVSQYHTVKQPTYVQQLKENITHARVW